MQEVLERLAKLEARACRMERQLHGWKLTALVLAVGCCAALPRPGLTAPEAGAVRAPFRVAGENGQTLLEIRAEEGAAVLELHGKPKKPGVILRSSDSGGEVMTCDEEGRIVASLTSLPGLGGHLQINAPAGKGTAIITAAPAGGNLQCTNFKGERIAIIGADALQAGRIDLNNADGEPSIVQMSGTQGGSIGVYNGADHLGVLLAMSKNQGQVLVGGAKDGSGVSLASTPNGGTVSLTGASREGAVQLAAGKGAGIRVTGTDPQQTLSFLAADTGTNAFLMSDAAGKGRCALTVDAKGSQFELSSSTGKSRVLLSDTEEGGLLQLNGANDKVAFGAGATPTGTGFANVYGSMGSVAASLGVNDENCGLMIVLNQARQRLAALTSDGKTGRLVLFDTKFAPVFSKP